MAFADRILTIVVTVALTSVFWIVAGGSLLDGFRPFQLGGERPATGQAPAVTAAEDTAETGARRSLERAAADVAALRSDDKLAVPVVGVEPTSLSDTYSDSRGGGERLHEAIDIMAARGTPVIAAAAGKVEKLFRSDAGGLTIYVRSPDGGTIHYYAHLDSYARGLGEGQQVRQGQSLGTVGSTGNASPEAPHLHFAVIRTSPGSDWWETGTAVNPYPLLKRD